MPELKGWKKYLAYAVLFAAAFVLALRQTFPAEAVRERFVLEAAASGWQVKVADVGPSGLLGVRFTGVSMESREGARIPVEELRASLRILPLVLGRRGVDFDARLYDGRVRGHVEEGRGARRLSLHVAGLDLAKAVAVRKATGLDLAGVVQGDVQLSLDGKDPAKSSGTVALRVESAAVTGGQLQLPAFGGALTVPRADLGALVVEGAVKDGKLGFEKLEARSADVELAGDAVALGLQPKLAYSSLLGRLRLKLAESFWQKSGTAALRGVAELALAQAKGRDGSYWFQLFGTVAQPQVRPAPQ